MLSVRGMGPQFTPW